jgi:hypothetical protein
VNYFALQSDTHSIEVTNDGTLSVYTKQERCLTVVNTGPDGTGVKQVPYSELGNMSKTPILKANWAGNRYVNVDIDCGAQRWNGTRSLRWLREGLYKYGFTKKEVSSIFYQMRKTGATVLYWEGMVRYTPGQKDCRANRELMARLRQVLPQWFLADIKEFMRVRTEKDVQEFISTSQEEWVIE